MVLIKDKIQSIGPKARLSLLKATVTIVVQTIHLRNVQYIAKHVIHVTKRGILSCIADPDRGVKAKENGGLTQGSPDVTNKKLPVPTTETKMMTPTGSNMNRTLCKYCSVKIFVQTLTLKQTFSMMKLMVKEFNVCLLT